MTEAIQRGGGRPETYNVVDGKRVPSVTTITNRFKDSGGLVQAANNVGLEGKTLKEAWYGAGSVGTQVHKMVEATLNGETPEQPTSLEAIAAFEAWQDWWQDCNFSIIATELPLVSEEHRFGGTIDTVLADARGKLILGDWKTSNALYPEVLLQVAAYGLLWNEHHPEAPVDGYLVARFSKEHGDLEHRRFVDLSDELDLFLIYRDAYDRAKAVKKRCG